MDFDNNNFGEYDDFGTITVNSGNKTTIYKPENNEQRKLYYKYQESNRVLHIHSALLLIKAFVLIFLGAIGLFLFPEFTIFIYLFVFAYISYHVYLNFNLSNELTILTHRVNKEIPHTIHKFSNNI